jgi:hypothetical protein
MMYPSTNRAIIARPRSGSAQLSLAALTAPRAHPAEVAILRELAVNGDTSAELAQRLNPSSESRSPRG